MPAEKKLSPRQQNENHFSPLSSTNDAIGKTQQRLVNFFSLNNGNFTTPSTLPRYSMHTTNASLLRLATLTRQPRQSTRLAQGADFFKIATQNIPNINSLYSLSACSSDTLLKLANIGKAGSALSPEITLDLVQNEIKQIFPCQSSKDLEAYHNALTDLQKYINAQLVHYNNTPLVPNTWKYSLQNHVGVLLHSFGLLLSRFLFVASPILPAPVIDLALHKLAMISATLRHLEWNHVIKNNTADLVKLRSKVELWENACLGSIHAMKMHEEELAVRAQQAAMLIPSPAPSPTPDAAGFVVIPSQGQPSEDATTTSTRKSWWRLLG